MYISNGQHYTYGIKTWDEIFAISSPEPWATVFCSDNFRVWWYHGDHDIWTTNDCVIMDVDTGNGTLATGTLTDIFTGADNTCQKTTLSTSSAKPLGPVLDVNTGQTKASVAMSGKYKCTAGATIVAANGLRADTTDGTMTDDATSDGSPNIGAFGNALEDGNDTDLLWINVFVKREMY